MWARTRPKGFHLFDKKRDPGEHRNVARRHPGIVRHLHRAALRRGGGSLPYYSGVDRD
jgi:hypothetical protein